MQPTPNLNIFCAKYFDGQSFFEIGHHERRTRSSSFSFRFNMEKYRNYNQIFTNNKILSTQRMVTMLRLFLHLFCSLVSFQQLTAYKGSEILPMAGFETESACLGSDHSVPQTPAQITLNDERLWFKFIVSPSISSPNRNRLQIYNYLSLGVT